MTRSISLLVWTAAVSHSSHQTGSGGPVSIAARAVTGAEATLLQEIVTLLSAYVCINIITLVIAVAAKWILLGRTRPGRYPLWGVYYYRWWLAQRFIALTHVKWFQGSPVIRV